MDKVIIQELSLSLSVGLDHWSRSQPSPHSITLVLSLPPSSSSSSAHATDDLASSINYSTSSKAAVALATSRAWPSLETCAGALASLALELGAAHVRVELSALKTLTARSVQLVLERGRGDGQGTPNQSVRVLGVDVRCIIGLNPQERLERQGVVVDLTFPDPPSSEAVPFPHKLVADAAHAVRPSSSSLCLASPALTGGSLL